MDCQACGEPMEREYSSDDQRVGYDVCTNTRCSNWNKGRHS
jgi:hypothetical protein